MLYSHVRDVIWYAALCAYILTTFSCNSSFDPFERREAYFSVFGYLDTLADTQYVRISPLRSSILPVTEPLDALVSSRHLETGDSVVWHEKIEPLPNGAVAHNFWTSQRIEPGARYRFMVTRSDGASAYATVAVPDSFPNPSLGTGAFTGAVPPLYQSIILNGIEHLADLRLVYYASTSEGAAPSPVIVSYMDRVSTDGNRHVVSFDGFEDVRARMSTSDCPQISAVEVLVAASGSEWIDLSGLDEETSVLPDIAGNIENGVGFLGGVAGKRIPWPEVLPALNTNRFYCLNDGYR